MWTAVQIIWYSLATRTGRYPPKNVLELGQRKKLLPLELPLVLPSPPDPPPPPPPPLPFPLDWEGELALVIALELASGTSKTVGTEYCWLEAVMTGDDGLI